eukprot:m.257115 g.257115  ORF g.257115 m.257115 type:complete len:191 (-) comp35000_c0_seq1:822-1394(-)
MSSIAQWVNMVGSQYGINTSPAVTILEEQGITMDIIPQITNAEWKELIKQVGVRTALRKAAADLADELTTPEDELREKVEAAREEKQMLEHQESQQKEMNDRYRQQIDMTQNNLSTKTTQLINECAKRDALMNDSMSASMEKNTIASSLASLSMQKATLTEEKNKAATERDAALVQARALATYATAIPGM